MKRLTSLTAVVILILTNWYGGQQPHLAHASEHWTLDNQMKVEERPYTLPENVNDPARALTRSRVNKLLTPNLRGMQRYCDGQCFYSPRGCDPFKLTCSLMMSVAMHNIDEDGEIYCDYFGDDNLRQAFCFNSEQQQKYRLESGKPDRFYTVTLYRNLGAKYPGDNPSTSCPKRWLEHLGRRCRRTEFVAVSFAKMGTSCWDLDPEDLWYVCTVDESHTSRVTMWSGFDDNLNSTDGKQRKDTLPHKSGGMGVVFSQLVMDEEVGSMGCQFIIQESNMTLTNPNPEPPQNAINFGNASHYPIIVKLAEGYVERDVDNGDVIIRPFKRGLYRETREFGYYKIYKGPDIQPQATIDIEKLEVKLVNASADYESDKKNEAISLAKMDELIKKCDHPNNYSSKYIACYPPNHQQNCIHTGRCPAMFIVEIPKNDTSFETIKAHLYGIIPESQGLRKARRPMGFVSVGFSKDDFMGRDVVITCHADGLDNVGVHVSINFQKANLYPGKVSYDELIYKKRTYASAEQNKLMCSWKMQTAFVVNMFAYEPDYQDCIPAGESEKLAFNFTEENVHLLIAAGNRNYPEGKINFHDFAQVINELFSKELFLRKAAAAGNIPCRSLLLNVFLLSILYFC